MGGGEGKAPALPFTIGLGQGRVNTYRPSGGGVTCTLLDPRKDIFRSSGFPYYIIFNLANLGSGNDLTVEDHAASTVIVIGPQQVGKIGIRTSGNQQSRAWFGAVYDRAT